MSDEDDYFAENLEQIHATIGRTVASTAIRFIDHDDGGDEIILTFTDGSTLTLTSFPSGSASGISIESSSA